MAIDPKTLTIGSHVNVRGKRVEIESITNDSQIGYYLANYDDWEACDPAEDWVEPIPITEELLTELGFEYTSHDFGMWWQKKIGKHNCEIDVRNDKWYVLVKGCDFVFDYLHELEQFLYLTTKTDLIKE